MSFSSVGVYRVVLQQYMYASHRILCIIKILPDKVSLFEKEPENDFNWMTAARWSKIESGLFRLFASIDNWHEDAPNVNTQMLIDHIKVNVSASKELLLAAQQLLQDKIKCDLGVEIVLHYMSHEDETIVSPKATKRKLVQKAKEAAVEPDKVKVNAVGSNKQNTASKSSNSEQSQANNAEPKTKRRDLSKSDKKRGRRSISQGNHRHNKYVTPSTKSQQTAPQSRAVKRSKTPPSRSTSVEPKTGRRSARSPVRPNRYNEFVMSVKSTRKTKQNLADKFTDSGSEKGSSSKPPGDQQKPTEQKTDAQKWSLDQLGGSKINSAALMELNDMLKVPKPREVKILLLQDMDEASVLSTFETYRADFDRLFKERQHKYQTTNYMSIDHYHIMDILNKTIRDSMMKKLAEVYNKSGPHGSLIINGLLPLWIVRLFMDKFKLTQQEAVHQIADQLKYDTYLRAVNNEPIKSFLDD
ncbi:uncharacterized protein CG4951 [Drosophila mojavensis]|uniref:Uncharacterized protein n=1 Tax=Drosophila mojavensis TaxID=7230 RepID=B4K9R6_DROMO|nr:uncharacterized protein CG4951 [Drosophila mojavensis]EDW14541.1 uncharacterized protein Dmoj_GI23268 [Drosophila mojavensis]